MKMKTTITSNREVENTKEFSLAVNLPELIEYCDYGFRQAT